MKTPMLIVSILIVTIVGVVASAFILKNMGLFETYAPVTTTTTTTGGVTTTTGIACTGGQTQTIMIKGADYRIPTTALTDANNLYRVCGTTNTAGTLTYGTAITTLSVGGCYEWISGTSATSTSLYDNSYGPNFKISPLPCVASVIQPLFQDCIEGSLTGTYWNANGVATTGLAVSVPATVEVRLQSASKLYFGNPFVGEVDYLGINWNAVKQSGVTYLPGADVGTHRTAYPGVVALKLNTTEQNQPDWVRAVLENGQEVEMNLIGCPTRAITDSSATGFVTYCYELPVISDAEVKMKIHVNPKIATITDGTAYFYPGAFYMNTLTGVIGWGSENNVGNPIGTSDAKSVTIDFTP